MDIENSFIVPEDEPVALHRDYYGIDSALEEDYSFRSSRFNSERSYAAANYLQRECAKKRGKEMLLSRISKKQTTIAVR